jgi:putative FmdB family regulatory protein
MPIYEYSCSNCGTTSDILQKVDEPAPERCEHCGGTGTLSKVVSRTSFVLKGGGWYSDLYGSTKKDKPQSTGTDSSGPSKGEPKSAAKGDAKSEAPSSGSSAPKAAAS